MGGFANLKVTFQKFGPVLEPKPMTVIKRKKNGESKATTLQDTYLRSEALEFLCVQCLFEIAGNLDSIAYSLRQIADRGK